MPISRKLRLFYDSSICIGAARGDINPIEWQAVVKFVSRNCQYLISMVTIHELLNGIATGGPNHFHKNKQALQMLYPAHQKTILPPPGNFVVEKLFGQKVIPTLDCAKLQRLIKTVLQIRDPFKLYSGQVWKGKDISPLAALIWTQLRDLEQSRSFASRWEFEGARLRSFSLEDWVNIQLKHYGQDNTIENRERTADGLSAAYCCARFFWFAQKDRGYNFLKHSSDRLDLDQVHYLVDPDINFVTGDSKLQKRIAESPQSKRVWTWEELHERAIWKH